MPDLADLYPGFASHWIDTSVGKIFARAGGSGPPLMLLHGYAQTNVMWHKVADALAKHFTLVIPDLPGYGWSAVPDAGPDHAPYTKRAMAAAMIEAMEALGHARFNLAGHDRGGRVAYRIAHWTFLALPAPGPENIIGGDPVAFWDWKTAPGTKARNLGAFDPRALAHYRAFFSDPLRIHATCEDYRAGRTTDLAHDEADREAGSKIACPMLALWGASGIPSETRSPLDTWRDWASEVRGFAIDCGHYLPEENPPATAAALIDFFGGR